MEAGLWQSKGEHVLRGLLENAPGRHRVKLFILKYLTHSYRPKMPVQ
jgi:hypothetical protein